MSVFVAVLCALRLKRLPLVCLCGKKSVLRCLPSSFPRRIIAWKLLGSCSQGNQFVLRWSAFQPRCGVPI
jgi:hypothetical protein